MFSLLEKNWIEKYPSSKFNHFSKAFTSIWPSNMGMSKLTCTLKCEVPPKWLLDEDAFDAIDIHWRMWEKFCIILFLCGVRSCSSNILIGSSAQSFFFSSTIEGFLGVRERLSSRETSLIPNFLYSYLVGDMHWKNWPRTSCSDTTNPDYFQHEMRSEI